MRAERKVEMHFKFRDGTAWARSAELRKRPAGKSRAWWKKDKRDRKAQAFLSAIPSIPAKRFQPTPQGTA